MFLETKNTMYKKENKCAKHRGGFFTIQMTASEAHKVKGGFYHHSYSYRSVYNQWSS